MYNRERIKPQAAKLVNEVLSQTHLTTIFEHALEKAYNDGAFSERQRLREQLEVYKQDSVVAKLLLELMKRDEVY